MTISISPEKKAEWSAGWSTVASGMIAMFLAASFMNSLGTFIAPLEAEFGWNREQVSMGVTIMGVIGSVMHAVSGVLVDRFGARHVGISATIFYCISLILLSQIGDSIWFWWLGSTIVGLAFGSMSSTVWISGAISHFRASRGLAIACVQVGTALALAFIPILAHLSIDQFGWRGAYLSFAAVGLVIVLPAVIAGFTDKRVEDRKVAAAGARALPGYELSEIFRMHRFWFLGISTFLAISGLYGISVHSVPLLVDRGIGRQEAAWLAGMIGFGSILGRLSGGLLLDYVRPNIVGAVAFSLPIAGAALLLTAGTSFPQIMLGTFLIGTSIGAEIDVIAYIAARLFGLRRYSTAFGLLVACMSVGAGFGPWTAAFSHDNFGNYDPFLVAAMVGFGISTLLIGTMTIPPESADNSTQALAGGH